MILRILTLLITIGIIDAEVFSESPDIIGTKGMVIDAGSGGSRLHVFTWKPRVFSSIPPPITIPEANELWTGRMAPGIDSLWNTPELVAAYLQPLIDFAKVTLGGYEDEFKNYPIYFKATGGMRELEVNQRENLLKYIRAYLSDKSQCPFYFRSDFARVISGEEEAIFSWAATNFLMGTLLPESQGLGSVVGVNKTYGTLDLGGASTQIAFYVPSQDINEGLYNLQIGSQKHWNVYTKSFLQFGVVSARLRHMHEIADKVVTDNNLPVPGGHEPVTHTNKIPDRPVFVKHSEVTSKAISSKSIPSASPSVSVGAKALSAVDYCFHSGYTESTLDSSGLYTVDVTGPTQPLPDQLSLCMKSVKDLMELKFGKFCNEVFHGDCSLAGAYQPPIPSAQYNHFIGQSTYNYPWKFFRLPPTASLELFKEKAQNICSLNFGDVLYYFESNNLAADPTKLNIYLPYYCFLSSYILVLLQDGYRFPLNQTLTVLDEVNGHSVGWALGAILYEINELPWELKLSTIESYPWGFVIVASVLGFILGSIAAVCIYREFVEEKRDVRPPVDYDIERIHRTPTLEMIGRPGSGMGSHRPSPPGSPQATTFNRKAVGGSSFTSTTTAFTTPYDTPVKKGGNGNDSLLNKMMSPFQQHKYEAVPDK